MGTRYSTLFKESTIPGLSTIFASKPRASKLLLMNVLIILVVLTFKDLYSIASDYFNYPITVSVLVTESRVLPFPAVTVCNLNPIHRGRFCSSNDILKPENIDKIVCTDLTDLFEVCKITESLKDLVDEGRAICEGTSGGTSGSGKKKKSRKLASPRKRNKSQNSNSDFKNSTAANNNSNKPKVRKGKPRRPNIRKLKTTTPESGEMNSTDVPLPAETTTTSQSTTELTETGLNIPDEISAKSIPGIDPFTRRAIDRKIKGMKNDFVAGGMGGQPVDHDTPAAAALNGQTLFVVKGSDNSQAVKVKSEDEGEVKEAKSKPDQSGSGEGDEDEDEEEDGDGQEGGKEGVEEKGKEKATTSPVETVPPVRQVFKFESSNLCPVVKSRSKRGDPQFNLRTLMATFKSIQKGNFTGGLLEPFMESGGLFDTIILQIASLYGINVNSTRDLLPALFMRAFTDVTGCSVGSNRIKGVNGSSEEEQPRANPVNEALDNLTTIFQKTGCIWKAPRILKLFQTTSQTLIKQLTSCTGPWVNELLGYNASTAVDGETPWFILLDLLETWMSSLSRLDPNKAMKIGHQSADLIKTCYFAGKKCVVAESFHGTFYPQHGNCFTYGMESGEAEKESLSGFTGPKFGLELMFQLEKDQYMPTSREAGVKIVVHDRGAKADPDQDAINISPGVVTYVGVQMLNITRLPAPYPDECTDEWQNEEYRRWAIALSHETYTIQVCLKICLQMYTMKMCKCWTPTAVWPPSSPNQVPECRTREDEECVDVVRHQYYDQRIMCHCTPRCTDRIYERSLSTGQETRQCSAIQSEQQSEEAQEEAESSDRPETSSADDKENTAKVIVYFHSLSFNQIKQEKKYTIEGLLGAIGGILGVYLGASFFAMFELGEVVLRGIGNGGGNKRSKTSPSQGPKDRRRSEGRTHRRRPGLEREGEATR